MSGEESSEVAIPFSRLKIGLISILGLVLVVAASYWAVLALTDARASLFAQVFWGLGASFGWLALGGYFLDLFRHEPGLVVNGRGFIFRPTRLGFGWVEWADVSNLREFWVGQTRLLPIDLRDPQKYIARGSWHQRWLKAANWRLYGSPIALTSVSLETNHASMVQTMQRFFSEAKCAESQPLSPGPSPM